MKKEKRSRGIKGILGGLSILVSMLIYSSAWAETGVSVASGYGAAHIVPIRFGFQKSFDKRWRLDSNWPIGGYFEGSFYALRGKAGPKPGSRKRVNAAALAGVIRFEHTQAVMIGWPYVELGIGLSRIDHSEIGGRDLGMRFQFEDRFGLGFKFGQDRQYDIGYKVVHFSNAYLGACNHGINLHMLMLGYWFK